MVDRIERKEKVRALIINNRGEMIVCNNNGVFLLPGGKIEGNETNIQALQREIKEELGLDFNEKEIIPFTTLTDVQNNYPKRNGEIVTREVTTHYYIIYSNRPIDRSKTSLTLSEKQSFNYYYSNCEDMYKLLSLSTTANPRKSFFDRELLNISHKYNQLKDIDMHTHTNNSDGEYSKEDLIYCAKNNNIDTLSICDHETMKAYDRDGYKESDGFILIPGVEIGCKVDRGILHILGYDLDHNDIELRRFLDTIHKNHIYNMRINNIGLKKAFGFCLPERTLDNLIKEDRIGRVYMAKELARLGVVNSVKEAFSRYLKKSHDIMSGEFKEVTWEETFDHIHAAGGLTVLAHPTSLRLSNDALDEFVGELAAGGLDGIETYNQIHQEQDLRRFEELAHKYNLYQTIGSDFHGEKVKPNVRLGNGSIDRTKIKKLSIVEDIKKRHL